MEDKVIRSPHQITIPFSVIDQFTKRPFKQQSGTKGSMLSFEPKARTFENLYYKSSLVAREVIVPKCLKAPHRRHSRKKEGPRLRTRDFRVCVNAMSKKANGRPTVAEAESPDCSPTT